MSYILLGIGPDGLRCAEVTDPQVPEDFVKPGEVVFTLHVLDVKARHNHEMPPEDQSVIDDLKGRNVDARKIES